MQFQCKIMPAKCIFCSNLIRSLVKFFISTEKLGYILWCNGSCMRDFNNYTIFRKHFSKFFCLFKNLIEILLKRIVQLHTDITSRTKYSSDFCHNFITVLIFISNISLWIINK